jgi:hypothetical protein
MKIKRILLLAFLFIIPLKAQFSERPPTNVRYIAGGYVNKSPFFKTLDAALNDVKTKASISDPYVFWIAGDTIKIADWDSIYTGSLLSIRDSINIYYVAMGKIKWAGFGFGSGSYSGGTTASLFTPTAHTTHYSYPTYTTGLPPAYDSIRVKDYAIDQDIWDLIVYTDSKFLIIENDTLKFDLNNLQDTLNSQNLFGWTPYDTTTIVRTTGNQDIDGKKTFHSGIEVYDTGYVRLYNYNPGLTRVIYGDADSVYYSANGITSKTLADINYTMNLLQAKIDTNYVTGDTARFSGTNSSLNIPVYGGLAADAYVVTPIYTDSSTAINTDDFCVVIPYDGGFYVKRGPAGTSDLAIAWIRRKP